MTKPRSPMARVSTGRAATGRIGAQQVRGGMLGVSPSRYNGKPNLKATAINNPALGLREQGIGAAGFSPRALPKGARNKTISVKKAIRGMKSYRKGDDTRRGA